MYDLEKPPLDELAHFGVKGMKWGQRKARETGGGSTSSGTTSSSRGGRASAGATGGKKGLSTGQKVAIGAGVGALIVGGGFVAYKLHKNGSLPIKKIDPSNGMELRPDFKPDVQKAKKDLIDTLVKESTKPVRDISDPSTRAWAWTDDARTPFEKSFDKFETLIPKEERRQYRSAMQDITEDPAKFDAFMRDPSKSLKLGSAGHGTSRFKESVSEKAAATTATQLANRFKRKKTPQQVRA